MNVLSSSFAVGASGGNGEGAPRSSGTGNDKSAASGFEAMLQGKSAPPAAKPPSRSSTTSKDNGAPDTTPRDDPRTASESEASRESDAPPATPPADKPTQAADDGSDEAPWPPLGLSAMLPAPVEAPPPAAPNANAAAPADPRQAPAPAALTALHAVPAAQAAAEDGIDMDLPLAAATSEESNTRLLDTEAPAPTSFNAMLQAQGAMELRGASAASAIDAPTPTPDLEGGDFDEAIGARVSWLAEQKIGHAHIRITPHDLGQVEVKLQLDGDRVHASFSSAHADVRHALESSLPRLREMLGEQGLQLAQADVGQQQTPQQGEERGNAAAGSGGPTADAGADLPPPTTHALRLRGLLDAYA